MGWCGGYVCMYVGRYVYVCVYLGGEFDGLDERLFGAGSCHA